MYSLSCPSSYTGGLGIFSNHHHVPKVSYLTSTYQLFDEKPAPIGLGELSKMFESVSLDTDNDFERNGRDLDLDESDRTLFRDRRLLCQQIGMEELVCPRSSPPSIYTCPPPTTPTLRSLSPLGDPLDQAYLELCQERERKRQLVRLQQLALQNQQLLGGLGLNHTGSTIISSAAPPSPSRSGPPRSRNNSGGRGEPICVFCRNNGEPVHQYSGHCLRDGMGRITCPILRAYKCPYCRASGDNAHTKTYCPLALSMVGGDSTMKGKPKIAKKKVGRSLISGADYARL